MKNTKEQIREIRQRERRLRDKKQSNYYKFWGSVLIFDSALLGLVAMRVFSLLPVSDNLEGQPGYFGSIFAIGPYSGFFFIIILSFILGISSTLLWMKIKEIRRKESRRKELKGND